MSGAGAGEGNSRWREVDSGSQEKVEAKGVLSGVRVRYSAGDDGLRGTPSVLYRDRKQYVSLAYFLYSSLLKTNSPLQGTSRG